MSFLSTYHVCFSINGGDLRDTTVEIPSDTPVRAISETIRAEVHPDIQSKGLGPEEGVSQRSKDCVIVSISLLGKTRHID